MSVAVIGGGIVGICTALATQETGADVTLYDPNPPGQGASFGNAGVISPWSIAPQAAPGLWKKIPGWLLRADGPARVAPSYALRMLPFVTQLLRNARPDRLRAISGAMSDLNAENVSLYRQFLQGTGAEDLIADSWYVHAFRNAEAARADQGEYLMRRVHGAQVERLDKAELHELEPALSHEFNAAVVIKGQARATDPGRIGTALCTKFQKAGGQLQPHAIERIYPQDGVWHLRTKTGTITAQKVVLCAGVWSAELLKPLGFNLPLVSERGYHLSFASPGVRLNNSVMDVDAKFVASSMETGLRAAGTAEFARPDAPPTQARIDALHRVARRMLPDLNTTQATPWMGVRPSLPDSLPCLGEVPGYPGLYCGFGHSHYGLMMAPKTGRILASLIKGERPNIEMSATSIARF